MNQLKKKPFLFFAVLFLLITALLTFIPVNIFPGMIVYEQGLQLIEVEAPLTLGNFIGLGINEGDLDGVKTFYLTSKGMAMAFIVCIGIPALIAYRFYVKSQLKDKEEK